MWILQLYYYLFNYNFYFDTVIGCILPTEPKNGRIVLKSEYAIKFLCDPLFIFSGTNENTRTLYCNKRNIWDKNLPNCVGMFNARFYSSDEITNTDPNKQYKIQSDIYFIYSISLYHLFTDDI